jgi:hypothetical protein
VFGGKVIELKNGGGATAAADYEPVRNVHFPIDGVDFQFDPNRIW